MSHSSSVVRRRRMRMVAGVAVAVLAVGGLTACEDNLPAGGGDAESGAPEDDGDDADDGAGEGDDAGADEGDAGDGDQGAGDGDGADGFLAAGESFTYDNGIEVTVYEAEVYEPGASVTHEGTPYKLQVSVTNNGEQDYRADPLMSARGGERGIQLNRLYDGSIDDVPRGELKPGRTITGAVAFDVAEGIDFMDVQVNLVGPDPLDPAYWSVPLD